jgi:hypothetical protein
MSDFKPNARGLLIPAEHFPDQRKSTCICGAEFTVPDELRALAKHVRYCAKRDDIQAEVADREENFAPLDPEQWEYGRKRIAEGKPGFRRGQAA